MKTLICICSILAMLLVGCAAGSATAGYSVRAKTAEELSPKAEDRLVTKIKDDIEIWLEAEYELTKKE